MPAKAGIQNLLKILDSVFRLHGMTKMVIATQSYAPGRLRQQSWPKKNWDKERFL
jgi:hypothetical protein